MVKKCVRVYVHVCGEVRVENRKECEGKERGRSNFTCMLLAGTLRHCSCF